jgi:hypothetical protein
LRIRKPGLVSGNRSGPPIDADILILFKKSEPSIEKKRRLLSCRFGQALSHADEVAPTGRTPKEGSPSIALRALEESRDNPRTKRRGLSRRHRNGKGKSRREERETTTAPTGIGGARP